MFILCFFSYHDISNSFHSFCWDAGSQEMQPINENVEICSNHEECDARRSQIKLTKGFAAKEQVKGHMASSFFHSL